MPSETDTTIIVIIGSLALFSLACYKAGQGIFSLSTESSSSKPILIIAISLAVAFLAGGYVTSTTPGGWSWLSLIVIGIGIIMLGLFVGMYRYQEGVKNSRRSLFNP